MNTLYLLGFLLLIEQVRIFRGGIISLTDTIPPSLPPSVDMYLDFLFSFFFQRLEFTRERFLQNITFFFYKLPPQEMERVDLLAQALAFDLGTFPHLLALSGNTV